MSNKINEEFCICMITTHILPNKKPMADLIRYVNLRDELKRRGNSIIIISRNTRLRPDIVKEDDFVDYKVPSIDIRWVRTILFMIFLIPTLMQICKTKKPEIIFSNSVMCAPALFISHWLLKNGIRIQYDVMGIVCREVLLNPSIKLYGPTQALLYNFLDKLMLKSADFITTINETHKKIIEKGTSKPIYIVRDAVNPEKFRKIEEPPQLKKNGDDIFIMFIGGISRRRIDLLFDIFPQIRGENPNTKLVIVGDGLDKVYYEKRAEELDPIGKDIVFTGYVPNDLVPSYLLLADICYSDVWSKIGFPMKVFEYMAMGKAIVVEDTESTREVLTNGINAFLYRDKKDLIEKIVLLTKNKELIEKLGRNARECTMKEHIWDQRGKELLSIYKRVREHTMI